MRKIKSIYERVVEQQNCIISLVLLQVIILGGLLNVVAVVSNDGRMPVYSNLHLDDSTHFSFQNFGEVNAPYLTDIIELPEIFDISFFLSIGDCLFLVFGILIISNLIVFRFRKKKLVRELEEQHELVFVGSDFVKKK